jgi:hypothetical protein
MPSTETTFDLRITEDPECFNTGQGWWHCSGCVVRCDLETSREHPLYRTLKAAIQAAGVDSNIVIAETLTTLLAEHIIETDHFAGEIDDLEGHIDELVRKTLCVDATRIARGTDNE